MPTTFSFLAPSVTKGRFTDERTGEYRDFSLNPNDLKDNKGFNYPNVDIPGTSHPVLQAGNGTERTITFTLRLDGDIGYRNRRSAPGGNSLATDQSNGYPVSVLDEILWYRHFLYPEGNARLGQPGSSPPVILFSFGPMYEGLPCVLKAAPVSVLVWTPDLRPRRADIQITLAEKILFTVNRSDIWDANRNFGF